MLLIIELLIIVLLIIVLLIIVSNNSATNINASHCSNREALDQSELFHRCIIGSTLLRSIIIILVLLNNYVTATY